MKIGHDVFMNSNVEITRPELATIGNHVAIDYGFYCTTQLTIGDYVHISPHVAVIGGKHTALYVEDFCFFKCRIKVYLWQRNIRRQRINRTTYTR